MDEKHLATPHDRTIPNTPASVEAYTALLTSILSNVPSNTEAPVCLIQISHAGLQSSPTINFSRSPFIPAVGPCSARPDTGSSSLGWVVGRTIWPTTSREIVDFDEWLEIVEKFVGAAKVAEEAGWDGVQVHSAHGYLLAEYLSPLVIISHDQTLFRIRKLMGCLRQTRWHVHYLAFPPIYPIDFIYST